MCWNLVSSLRMKGGDSIIVLAKNRSGNADIFKNPITRTAKKKEVQKDQKSHAIKKLQF